MRELIIDMTDQQHQALSAMAAREGKTVKEFALEKLLAKKNAKPEASAEIRALLAERVAQAKRGDVVHGSISEIEEQALRIEQVASL
ncbi:antitoxin ParD [Thiorhodovibrio frisius]|uniref:Antitoxin ParD n=1 Tax=Thiorhodovibrio frisius TaxID=631362 RepID=H8Z656_9GAMM|nr:antitoxin ParD [Thiorhodovibrio frisius]EIC19623.1 Antitoxin ParD [Thiorhodovibrio frisius]WPL20411.1 Antitoxin ParD [Thiorhodovibrio frisius]